MGNKIENSIVPTALRNENNSGLYYGKTENLIAQRDRLETANKLATKFPRAAEAGRFAERAREIDRLFGSDAKGKMSVNEIMRDLEIKSHAFWNR